MYTPRWDGTDLPRTPYRVRGGDPLDLPPLGGDVALSSTTESSATVDSHETVTRRASRDACDNQMRVTCESPRG